MPQKPPFQKKSIVFFAHSAGKYGAELWLLETLKLLNETYGQNYEFYVVLPSQGPFLTHLKKMNIPYIIHLYKFWVGYNTPFYKKLLSLLFNLFFLPSIILKVRKLKPDLICTNTITSCLGAIVAYVLKKPHIWFVHEFGKEDHNLSFHFNNKISLGLIKNLSTFIVTFSKTLKNHYQKKMCFKNIISIYQPVKKPISSKKLWPTHNKSFKCVLIATLTETKGQLDAINALNLLKDKIPQIELVLMGDGSEKYIQFLNKKIKQYNLYQHVFLLGYVPDPTPYILASDLVLVCSRQEAFGRATVEGMLCKKPIIATSSGANKELIKSSFNGLFYTYGEPTELAQRILYLYKSPELRKKMSNNAYAFALPFQDQLTYCNSIHQLFNDAISKFKKA